MHAEQWARQIRMARAALGWSVRDLAQRANVSPDTVTRAEKADETVRRPSWGALQTALERAGIEFFENGSVLAHGSTDGAAITVSPNMPNEVRFLYPS